MTELRALNIFGINLSQEFGSNDNIEEANRKLVLMKEKIKKIFREKAKQVHPDHQGSHERMAELNNAKEICMKLKVIPKTQPMETIVDIRPSDMYRNFYNRTATSFTGTFTWTGTAT